MSIALSHVLETEGDSLVACVWGESVVFSHGGRKEREEAEDALLSFVLACMASIYNKKPF